MLICSRGRARNWAGPPPNRITRMATTNLGDSRGKVFDGVRIWIYGTPQRNVSSNILSVLLLIVNLADLVTPDSLLSPSDSIVNIWKRRPSCIVRDDIKESSFARSSIKRLVYMKQLISSSGFTRTGPFLSIFYTCFSLFRIVSGFL